MLRRLEIARTSFTFGQPNIVQRSQAPREVGSAQERVVVVKRLFIAAVSSLAVPLQELNHKVQRFFTGPAALEGEPEHVHAQEAGALFPG